MKELKTDNSIIILPADKGRATVFLNRSDYKLKTLDLLNDRHAYRISTEGEFASHTRSANKALERLKAQGHLSQATYLHLKPKDRAIARFYGLPKVPKVPIHKPNWPLRPIVALRGTLMFDMAHWVAEKLKPLVKDWTTTVNSPGQFLEKLKGVTITVDEVMASFYVVSLFTSMPRDLATRVIAKRLERCPDTVDMPKEKFIELLGFCLKTHFTFNGTTYEQVKGTLMGSPVASVIAEAVLQELEATAFRISSLTFWARYVDDTFTIVRRDQVGALEERLNSIFPDVQFTTELEKDKQLLFLDVMMTRTTNGDLATTVYRKVTNTLIMLHFCSDHPIGHKVSCLRALFNRINSHCSTEDAKRTEEAHLGKMCTANGYTNDFIRRHIRKHPQPKPMTTEDQRTATANVAP